MDLFVLLVIAGCAILGLIWGALKMGAAGAALAAAILAGRWVGPVAAQLFTHQAVPGSHERLAGAFVAGIVAAVLVWLAGLGLRRGVKALHLGFLDRLGGLALGGAAAVVLLALLFGLAALGGHPPSSPWASRLSQAGLTWLAVQKFSASSSSPSSAPRTPTSKGQQPH